MVLRVPRTNGTNWLLLLVLGFLVPCAMAPVCARAEIDCRTPEAECTLREAARQIGVGIGAIREGGAPADIILEDEFNSLTVTAYWNLTHPEPGVYDFNGSDANLEFAEARGMSTRGHTLIWDQLLLDATPDWVTTMTDAEALRALMDEHIRTVVGHFRGRIDSWDVVNEPIQTIGSNLYENVFLRLLGPDYIADAFRAANEADPDADLFLNEIVLGLGPIAGEAKLAAFYDLVRDLLDQGVPIHGVGFQGHFFVPPTASWVYEAVRSFGQLGIAVEFTEVDVPQRDVEGKEALQRHEYFQVFSACLAVPACRRITIWGVSDQYSWLNWFLAPGLAPLLFDDYFGRKPAYEGVYDSLLAYIPRDLSGERIALRDHPRKPARRRLVVASRAPALTAVGPVGFGDPTELGGSLRLLNPATTEQAVIPLPAAGWSALGDPPGLLGYRFRDADEGPCRYLLVRPGKKLRVRCSGAGIDFTLDEPSQEIMAAELRLADAPLQCFEFGGDVRRDHGTSGAGNPGLFRARRAPASTRCSMPSSE